MFTPCNVTVVPPLQHLLQHVLPLLCGLLHGALLITDVPQLTGRVRLHRLASAPLFSRTSHHAGLLNVNDKELVLKDQLTPLVVQQQNSVKQIKLWLTKRESLKAAETQAHTSLKLSRSMHVFVLTLMRRSRQLKVSAFLSKFQDFYRIFEFQTNQTLIPKDRKCKRHLPEGLS